MGARNECPTILRLVYIDTLLDREAIGPRCHLSAPPPPEPHLGCSGKQDHRSTNSPPTISAGCQVTLSPPRRHALTLPLACSETSAQTHHQPSQSQPHRGGPFQAPQQTGHKRQARLHRSTVSSADIPLAQSIPPTQGVAPSVVHQLHKVERGGDMMVSWGRRLCQALCAAFCPLNRSLTLPPPRLYEQPHSSVDTNRSKPTEQSLSHFQVAFRKKNL